MRLTPDQYLELERKAGWKSEYYDGNTIEMPPVNACHNSIAWRLARLLSERLGPRTNCEPFTSRIRILTSGLFTYPDLSVACEAPQFIHAADDDTLLNPTVLFEVCSPKNGAMEARRKGRDLSQNTLRP
jgi:Uma2 family endonuclease